MNSVVLTEIEIEKKKFWPVSSPDSRSKLDIILTLYIDKYQSDTVHLKLSKNQLIEMQSLKQQR